MKLPIEPIRPGKKEAGIFINVFQTVAHSFNPRFQGSHYFEHHGAYDQANGQNNRLQGPPIFF